MPSTILGRILIDGRRLVAETNSERRAKLFRKTAEGLLSPGSRHLSTVLESVEAALEAYRADNPSGRPVREDCSDLPEVQALLSEQMRSHYRAWTRMKIPALKDKTPMQAMRTQDGREMVEALLLDLEQQVGRAPGLTADILEELRATLDAAGPAGGRDRRSDSAADGSPAIERD